MRLMPVDVFKPPLTASGGQSPIPASEIAASADAIFLLAKRPSGGWTIIRLTPEHTVHRLRELPEVRASELKVDFAGNVLIRQSTKDGDSVTTLALYPVDQQVSAIHLGGRDAVAHCLSRGAVFYLDPSGYIIEATPDSNLPITRQEEERVYKPEFHRRPRTAKLFDDVGSPGLLKLLCTGERTIVVLNTTTAEFVSLDSETGELNHVVVDAPEIQDRVPTQRSTSANGPLRIVVRSAASNYSNSLYLLLSPFRPSEGAIILKVGAHGDIQGNYRCILPPIEANNGKAFMPTSIATVRDAIYLLDRTTGLVAAYSPPTHVHKEDK